MPQIVIQIGDSPNPSGFRDNDIVHAWNDTYLLWRHTQILTDHRKIGGGFFKPFSSLAYHRLRAFSKWMFERVSRTEIRRTLLSDMSSEILSNIENAKEEAIDVPLYVAMRLRAGKRAMFGEKASVVWFEGQRDVTVPRMEAFWTDHITPQQTGLLASDHKQRPHSTSFLKRYLVIGTNDFSNERRGVLEEPDLDDTDPDNSIMIAPRKHNIDWRVLPGISGEAIDRIADRSQRVDPIVDPTYDQASIVRVRVRA